MKVWPLVNITSLCIPNIHWVFSVWHENYSRSDSPTNLKSSYLGLLLQMLGFLCGSDGKESACRVGDLGLIPGWGRSPGEGNGNPLCLSCMENSMDRILLVGYSPWGHKELDATEWQTVSSKCSLSISSSYFFPVIFLSLWWFPFQTWAYPLQSYVLILLKIMRISEPALLDAWRGLVCK